LKQLTLGRLPNVWFDTASLIAYYAEEGYPWPGAGAVMDKALEYVGAAKVLWGTDVPGALLSATYAQNLEAFHHYLRNASSEECHQVLGGNAKDIFGDW
jgi:hypothetical protein